ALLGDRRPGPRQQRQLPLLLRGRPRRVAARRRALLQGTGAARLRLRGRGGPRPLPQRGLLRRRADGSHRARRGRPGLAALRLRGAERRGAARHRPHPPRLRAPPRRQTRADAGRGARPRRGCGDGM
ncbi:MAG: 4-hydroxybenzoyl-CoA thioesterase family active site, partial [uncultured Rubrobacteraceae bacterium]